MKINEKNLYIFATSPPFDCDGFLYKKGEVNKAFQRRYFVLKGNLLFYFEKKGDKEPLGLIIVEGCTIELSEDNCDQYCFEIAFNGNRSYVLSAESQESMETWMKALTCAGYEYKKLMVAELQRQLEEIEGTRNKKLAESSTNIISLPKPPPRRQNPFNRPAPPLPSSNNSQAAEVTFINGHFGSSSQRSLIHSPNIGSSESCAAAAAASTASISAAVNPIPPPRGIQQSAVTVAGKSEFYQQLPNHIISSANRRSKTKLTPPPLPPPPATTAAAHHQQTSVFHTPKSVSYQSQSQSSKYSSQNFEKMHEKFRNNVMKDIIEYRKHQQLRLKPLIEL